MGVLETGREGPETGEGVTKPVSGWGALKLAAGTRGSRNRPRAVRRPRNRPGDPLIRSYFSGRTSMAEVLICASGVAIVPKPNRRLRGQRPGPTDPPVSGPTGSDQRGIWAEKLL